MLPRSSGSIVEVAGAVGTTMMPYCRTVRRVCRAFTMLAQRLFALLSVFVVPLDQHAKQERCGQQQSCDRNGTFYCAFLLCTLIDLSMPWKPPAARVSGKFGNSLPIPIPSSRLLERLDPTHCWTWPFFSAASSKQPNKWNAAHRKRHFYPRFPSYCPFSVLSIVASFARVTSEGEESGGWEL